MDPSAQSQFRALSYRQISARIGNVAAKASVMRLLGVARLPLPPFVLALSLATILRTILFTENFNAHTHTTYIWKVRLNTRRVFR